MVWEGKPSWVGICLACRFCDLGSGFLATDYMSFLQSPGTQGQNIRPNRLSKTLENF